MSRKICIIDTSIFCCWLRIPSKETAGQQEDMWDFERTNAKITSEIDNGSTLVLPLATLIETGNHIAQAPHQRFELAQELANHLAQSARSQSPWAAFTEQAELWTDEKLLELSRIWPALAAGGTSMGDATIKDVADYYFKANLTVEILTADQQLKAYQPQRPTIPPPRRRR